MDPMAEIRASFFLECEELMESLQDALRELDEGDSTSETINVIFRAVHSIKGGAGAFGLDALVAFAHRFETVLDELRAGRLIADAKAIRLFFKGADLLQDQILAAKEDGPEPEEAESAITEIEALIGGATAHQEEVIDFAPTGFAFDLASFADVGPQEFSSSDEPSHWQIAFTPTPDFYRSGNEPLFLLRTLNSLGRCETICSWPEDMELSIDAAETPRLSWQIKLFSDSSEAELMEVFDFVRDVSAIELTYHPGQCDLREDAPSDAVIDEPNPTTQLVKLATASEQTAPPTEGSPQPKAPSTPEASSTVRVDIEKIDRLVNLVGELVINQAMLAQSVSEAGIAELPSVMNGLEEFMMLTRDIQDSVMMIRAQPVKPLFQRMSRIVREASHAVGKQVRLKTEGEATEVDKTVIERLSDPLTHMIRNAVDHGLETPEARIAAGKSPEGVITLSASHRAGRVLIEVADDGAGINRPKVREIAIQRGLISADVILSDAEIDALLFQPGFSTASQISNLSGRGVGMDVVKSAISALGGRISILSEPGRGTRFSISLPLTLAVLDGMVVRVADQTLVIPLSSIIETATLTEENIKPLGPTSELLHIRGDFVSLHDLGVQLGFRSRKGHRPNAIVILTTRDDGNRAALVVDAIMEQRQVVIKGLGDNYGHIPGVAAATILGDGQIALILDPSGLTQPNTADLKSDRTLLAG